LSFHVSKISEVNYSTLNSQHNQGNASSHFQKSTQMHFPQPQPNKKNPIFVDDPSTKMQHKIEDINLTNERQRR